MSNILTLNAGSSSIKFSVFEPSGKTCLTSGLVERIGGQARLTTASGTKPLGQIDHSAGVDAILESLGNRGVNAVGHRIVHGGPNHRGPAVVSDAVYAELHALVPLAPLHQPHNLAAIDAARAHYPDATQVACFDTAFHRTQPFVNDTYALPRALYEDGIRRYGFHGLSYDFINGQLGALAPGLQAGRVIVAHLGNGASMCGMIGGRAIGSTMGFTALDGLPMGTRSGQIDPGVLLYLLDHGWSSERIAQLLYNESGLLGLSGLSHDMRDLLASNLPEAQEAIDYYVFHVRHEIGALAADLGGLDGIVFCGGIGENSPEIRARVLDGMGWLGLGVNAEANAKGEMYIGKGRARALVMKTDEEAVIARQTAELAA